MLSPEAADRLERNNHSGDDVSQALRHRFQDADTAIGALRHRFPDADTAIGALRHRFQDTDTAVSVIGHRSPDVDSVTSAMALSALLEHLGIPAVPKIAGPVNRETAYFLETFGEKAPDILEDATGCQLWLVDHSDYHQAVNGAEQASIAGIVDHHKMGDAKVPETVCLVDEEYVSTATIVYWIYVNFGIDIPQRIARLLLAGMMSDSNHMLKKGITDSDRESYAALIRLSGYDDADADELNQNRRKAKYDHTGQSVSTLFYSDNKVYELEGQKYGISNVAVYSREDVKKTADLMRAFMQEELNRTDFEYLICMIQEATHQLQRICFAGKNPEKTRKLMEAAFGDDSEKAEEDYIHYPGLSRKRDVAPRFERVLADALRRETE